MNTKEHLEQEIKWMPEFQEVSREFYERHSDEFVFENGDNPSFFHWDKYLMDILEDSCPEIQAVIDYIGDRIERDPDKASVYVDCALSQHIGDILSPTYKDKILDGISYSGVLLTMALYEDPSQLGLSRVEEKER